MLAFKGPAQPSPALGEALNGGYSYLEVRCLGCDTHQTVALEVIRRPKTTPIHELERYMRCKDCSQVRGHPYKRSHLAAVDRTATESLRRRFFVPKHEFSEKEKAFFLNVDFVGQVALVATIEEGSRQTIIGGGPYVVTEPGEAEVAFIVVDAYQGLGIGTMLPRHLLRMAHSAGLKELVADVLPENTSMHKVLGKFGFQIGRSPDPQVVRMTVRLSEMDT